jgi:DNA-binding NarL/FixJ family response regulator
MPTSPSTVSELTPEDLALLRMLARGMTGSRLSRELEVNPRTVQRRIERLRCHFQVPTTIQTVVAAVRQGLI